MGELKKILFLGGITLCLLSCESLLDYFNTRTDFEYEESHIIIANSNGTEETTIAEPFFGNPNKNNTLNYTRPKGR